MCQNFSKRPSDTGRCCYKRTNGSHNGNNSKRLFYNRFTASVRSCENVDTRFLVEYKVILNDALGDLVRYAGVVKSHCTEGDITAHVDLGNREGVALLSDLAKHLAALDHKLDLGHYLDKKIGDINCLIAKKEKAVKELETYKKSLIYEYVTGKKEVPA